MCVRVHVCHCSIRPYSRGTRNQEQPQEQGCYLAHFALLHFAMLSAAASGTVCLYHTVSFWRCGRHGITVLIGVLQGLRLVTAANGASVWARGVPSSTQLRHNSNPHFL